MMYSTRQDTSLGAWKKAIIAKHPTAEFRIRFRFGKPETIAYINGAAEYVWGRL